MPVTLSERPAQPLTRRSRLLAVYSVVAALGATVAAPLLGMAYFATADGLSELDSSTVSWWAEPARDAVGPLLTFGSPDRVYATYVQLVGLLFPAVLISALTLRSRRSPRTRPERWGWRIMLTGYALLQAGVAVVSVLLIPGQAAGSAVNVAFLSTMIPGLLLGTIGSTTLGVSLVRQAFRPRGTAWLLAVAFPGWFAGSALLGHNSIGMLPMFFAWGVLGATQLRAVEMLAREPQPAVA